jgi:hypothetical protein
VHHAAGATCLGKQGIMCLERRRDSKISSYNELHSVCGMCVHNTYQNCDRNIK